MKTKFYLVELESESGEYPIELLTGEQLAAKYPQTVGQITEYDQYCEANDKVINIVLPLHKIEVGFMSVDSYGKTTWISCSTPANVMKAIESRVGSLDLPGLVSEDGVVRCTGIYARTKGSKVRNRISLAYLRSLL